MLRQNPNALFMDCTYKTNRDKMPLWDIVGCTACNKTFYAGFGFISDVKGESYKFILGCLSNESRRWFEKNAIEPLDWPPYSPDLNPIENL